MKNPRPEEIMVGHLFVTYKHEKFGEEISLHWKLY